MPKKSLPWSVGVLGKRSWGIKDYERRG